MTSRKLLLRPATFVRLTFKSEFGGQRLNMMTRSQLITLTPKS